MNELANISDKGLMPALTIDNAIARYNAVIEFTKAVMKPGKDFGVIPGTGDKPTLLKPGAEKLCSLFGLVPDFEIVDRIVDFAAGLFYYHYKCLLSRDGKLVATSEGSANSREKKYRYRYIPEFKATDEEKATAIRAETRTGQNGKPYKMLVMENSEPFDLINTLQKMAQKRALVAATLIAANASEFFTQDIEDMVLIEGEFVEIEEHETREIRQASKLSVKPSNGGSNVDTIYQAVVDAKLSENIHAAKNTLQKYCQTGFDTEEKALAWMKLFRGWRDTDKTPEQAAKEANAGNVPK